MSLNLIRRLIKGSPLTAVEHDGNLDKLEDAIEAREATGTAATAVSAHVAAADPHPQYLTSTEGNAAYAPAAQGVTNGNSHDHNGGDGAQIAYSSLSGLPTLPTGTNTGDQTLTNTSNATSHTVTLSGSGGSLQLVEGTNVTLTTSGTGSAGVVTISASGGGGGGHGTVTSVGLVAPTGFSVSGSPVTTSGDITLAFAAGYSLPTTASQGNWDTAFAERLYWDGGVTGLNAATGRASLGLGGAAVLSVGTSAGTVAAGDDSRITGALAAVTAETTYQPLDSDLTAIAGLATATFGRSLLTQADAAAARTTLGVSNSVYAVNNWFVPFDGNMVAGSALTANTIALYPFIVRRNVTVNNLGARVTTVAASSNVQLAVYGSDSSNEVTGTALAATGNLSGATATSVNGSVTAFTMQAGQIYWMAINSSGTPTMLVPSALSMHLHSILGAPLLADVFGSSTISLALRTVAQTFGTWPDLTSVTPTVVGASANASKGALIAMQVSALP